MSSTSPEHRLSEQYVAAMVAACHSAFVGDDELLRLTLEKLEMHTDDVGCPQTHILVNGHDLLSYAVSGRSTECVRVVLSTEIATDTDLANAAQLAARQGLREIFCILLEAGADVGPFPVTGTCCAHISATEGHLEILRALRQHDTLIDCVDTHGLTPLFYACLHHQTECAKALIQWGARVNVCEPFNGSTLLHVMALTGGPTECTQALLDAGASPLVRNAEGLLPREAAMETSSSEDNSRHQLEMLSLLEKAEKSYMPSSLATLCKQTIQRTFVKEWRDKQDFVDLEISL